MQRNLPVGSTRRASNVKYCWGDTLFLLLHSWFPIVYYWYDKIAICNSNYLSLCVNKIESSLQVCFYFVVVCYKLWVYIYIHTYIHTYILYIYHSFSIDDIPI